MGFKKVPKGKIVPFYLTDEGDVYPLLFHSEEEIDLIGSMVGALFEHSVVVDTRVQINDNRFKFSIQANSKTEK